MHGAVRESGFLQSKAPPGRFAETRTEDAQHFLGVLGQAPRREFAQFPCARSARIPLILFPAHSERVIQPYFTTAAGITGGVQLSTSCRPPEIALGALSSQGICLRGENTNKFPQFPTPGPPGIALGIHPPT